jgi:predicted HicB family RNase H-like nuclease
MSALRYKDFQGSVEFEDSRLVIQILHINDLVTTEIDSATQAQAAFEELVDDYLASCAELGKEPSRPFKGSFNVRVTPDLHRQVAIAAADARETMNAWISRALEERVERQKARKALPDRRFVDRLIEDRPVTVGYSHIESLSSFPLPMVMGPSMTRPTSGRLPPAFERQRSN